MNSYAVELKPSARKELESLPDSVLARVVRKVESLAHDPRPAGCKKLKGYKDQWRVRISDWRAVYIINDAARLVSVTRMPTVAKSTISHGVERGRKFLKPTYSATTSFSITTFKCAVTSLCSFTGTVNSPRVFSGS